MDKKLYLLDGMALIYRAHFALIRNPILTSKGFNTSALFGFTNTVLQILEEEQPTHLAVAFDTAEPTERHVLFPEYKAQREAIPEDIAASIEPVKEMLGAFRIPVLTAPGFEADDIIGTLAVLAEPAGFDTYMVTPDKDFGQLVTEHAFVYKPGRSGSDHEILGVPEVTERWGIERPEQVIDILGLAGDSSDNIPGIRGIGEKTARTLIARFGSVEELIRQAASLKGKQRERVEEQADQARLCKQLATIRTDVPLTASLDDLALRERDDAALKRMLVEFEFNSLGKRLLGAGFQAGRGFSAAPAEGSGTGEETGETQGELFPTLRTLADTPHTYHLVDTETGHRDLAEQLHRLQTFCFDTETSDLDPKVAQLVGLSFAWTPGTAYYVPVPEDAGQAAAVLDVFRPALENPAIEKTGHNLKFDLKVLLCQGCRVQGTLFDTMLAHCLAEPEQRHGMDQMAEALLGYSPVPISALIGDRGEEQRSMREVPVEEAKEYAAEDADITLRLRAKVEPPLAKLNQEGVYREIEARLIPVLADMELAGVAIDVEALRAFSTELAAAIGRLETDIFRLAGREFNLNSPKQMGEVLFDELKLEEDAKKTRTGQYATNEPVLTRLAGRHEIARLILEHREATKLKSTYVDALPSAVFPGTGRIHTTFRQLSTATGRLASHDPNLQNIPIRTEQGQEIRKAFIPRDEAHVLLSADYSQIELRIMAHLSGDPNMRAAFEAGIDIHAATAARVHGVDLDTVTPEMRRQAKMVNYGLMYGMSVFGLGQRLGIPRAEAKEIVEAYFTQFPSVKGYIDRTVEKARETGYVETMAGRRRYLRDITSRNNTIRQAAERNAVNTPIQGSGADMIKIAMIRIHAALAEQGLSSRMALQIHDELLLDARKDELDRVTPLVERCMREAMPLDVPVVVDLGNGSNWLEAH